MTSPEHEIKIWINSKGQAVCKECNIEMEWLWDLLQCPNCKLTLSVEAYYRFLQAYGTPELRYPV